MMRKSFVTAIKTVAVAFLFIVLLFANAVWGSSPGFIGSVLREVTAVFRDPKTQWMVFLCLGSYFTTFFFLRFRAASDFWQAANANPWLVCMLLISAVRYAIYYSPSTQALTLLGGAVIGQGLAVWANFNSGKQKAESGNCYFVALFVSLFVILLALASIWNGDSGHFYEYHSSTRRSGPWDNPNIFGLLMGTGVSLALGLGVSRWKMEDGKSKMGDRNWKLRVGKYAIGILCFVAVMLTACGLLHSYSRGAWLATFCGSAYLLWQCVNREIHQTHESNSTRSNEAPSVNPSTLNPQNSPATPNWFHRNWLPLGAIVFFVGILSFWHFRQTEWHPAHRAFSVGNQNDFSWRNRLSAWEGALQITAERPWFGAGWKQPEPIYDQYYRAPKVVEGLAIQMNDYLLLGATLGIPALFCFGMYLWLSLFRNSAFSLQPLELLPATCRAGAIVLLVGFWFDGGLFTLATASTFWILLELGRRDLTMAGTK